MKNRTINITAFLLSMLWAAFTEFELKKQELNKYLEEVTSYWDNKCKDKEQQLNNYHERPHLFKQRIEREISRIKRDAEKEIAKAKQYVEKELKAAEKRLLKKDMAAERLAEKQLKAAQTKANRQSIEEDIDLGVFGELVSVDPNDARIQRHCQTISDSEYDRTEKRRGAKTNRFAIYKLDDKIRKTERKNSRDLKYSSFM